MKYVAVQAELTKLLAESRNRPVVQAAVDNQRCLTDADLVALGASLRLPLEQIALLCLKRQWEELVGRQQLDPENLSPGARAWQQVKSRFRPDQQLWHHFAKHGLVGKTVAEEQSFDALLREIILADLYAGSADDAEFEAFLQRRSATQRVVETASAEEAEELATLNIEWLQLHEVHDEELLHRETVKLGAARDDQEFLHRFPEFLDQQRQAERERLVQLKVDYKKANQTATRAEVDDWGAAEERRSRAAIEDWSLLLAQPLPVELLFSENAHYLTPWEIVDYEEQSMHVLRETALLLHSDRIWNNPVFERLTAKQKSALADTCRQILSIRPEELRHPRGTLGYSRRALEVLERIRQRVKRTLANAGIDTDLRFVQDPAATAAERIRWYKKEIAQLTRDISRIRAEVLAILEDPDLQERRYLVFEASPDEQESKREHMRQMAGEHKRRADLLTVQLEALFQAPPQGEDAHA